MVINEKGLMVAMKKSYADAGYTIDCRMEDGAEMVRICGTTWTVVIQKDQMPRKVLGLIAEHIGLIPEIGKCYLVRKKEVQTQIFDEDGWFNPMEEEEGERLIRTVMTMNGKRLLQCAGSGKIVALRPLEIALLEYTVREELRLVRNFVIGEGNVSRVYIIREVPDSDREQEWFQERGKVKWVAE